MKPYPNSNYSQSDAVYRYFLTEFPQVIHFVQNLIDQGYTPEEIEEIAEQKIGVCETSYSARLIAQYLSTAV